MNTINVIILACVAEKITKRQLSQFVEVPVKCVDMDSLFLWFDRPTIKAVQEATGIIINGETNYLDFCFLKVDG